MGTSVKVHFDVRRSQHPRDKCPYLIATQVDKTELLVYILGNKNAEYGLYLVCDRVLYVKTASAAEPVEKWCADKNTQVLYTVELPIP